MQKPFYVYTAKKEYKGKIKIYFTYTITEASGLPETICRAHRRKGITARNKSEATQKIYELIQELKSQSTYRSAVGLLERLHS